MPAHGFKSYDALPPVIQFLVTREEYAWMSDEQKQTLEHDYTQPDPAVEEFCP